MTDRFEHQMEENASLLQRLSPAPLTRRRMLLGGGAAALGVVAAACGTDRDPFVMSDPDPSLTEAAQPRQDGGGGGDQKPTGDVAIAMTAASLEVLAVNTYDAALSAASEGAIGDVPAAVAEYATTAKAHHEAHRDAWNELLRELGEQEVSSTPPSLQSTVDQRFSEVSDVTGVAELALTLEQIAADTYFSVIPKIQNPEALRLATTIQPIDMQHVAVLRYVMGEYPVPDAFADAADAFTG